MELLILGCKEHNQSDFNVVESSLGLLEKGVCYDQCVQTLLACALLHFVLQGQTCLLFWDLLTSFCIPIPYDEKDFFFFRVLEDLVGLHRIDQLQLLWHQWLGHRPGLL